MSPCPALAKAAARCFLDVAPFLRAFRANPRTAIITLRDMPTAYGSIRSYVGKTAIANAHARLLAAARAAWKAADPLADVIATRRRRKQ